MVNFPKFNQCLSKISTELCNNISKANLYKPRAKFFAKRGYFKNGINAFSSFKKLGQGKVSPRRALPSLGDGGQNHRQIYIFHFIFRAPEPILIRFGIKIFNWTCPLPLPLLGEIITIWYLLFNMKAIFTNETLNNIQSTN